MAFANCLCGQRIQHVVFCQPGAAGLQNAVADLFHVRGVMGVGVDHDLHALLLGLAEVDVVQVEAVGIGIQLHRNFVFRGGRQNGVHVECVGVAAQLNAAGGMSEERGIRILDGFQQALGHLCGFLIEDGVHAGDDDIHLREHVVGEIEVAVGQDIDFDAGKDRDAFDLAFRRRGCAGCARRRACHRVRWRRPDSSSGR